MTAGPSEILIVADQTSNPEWIASDLIGQAEHDPLAQCILISKNKKILNQTKFEITRQLKEIPRSSIAQKSLMTNGILMYVNSDAKIIEILNNFHFVAEAIPDHHGVFVKKDNGQLYKIASIGLKVKKWVTYHGFSININPDLSHYEGIKPCGMSSKFVTSFSDLGYNIKSKEIDKTIEKTLVKYFN